MIVDLRLGFRKVLVVGGGREATKKITSMAAEGCAITVVSPVISDTIADMAISGCVSVIQESADVAIVERIRPDMVVAATDDHLLNRALVIEAHRHRMLGYSSSDPEDSDYAHMAQTAFGDVVKVAVSTGGRSPAAAKRIRDEIKSVLTGIITPQMLQDIEAQGAERASRTGAAAR